MLHSVSGGSSQNFFSSCQSDGIGHLVRDMLGCPATKDNAATKRQKRARRFTQAHADSLAKY